MTSGQHHARTRQQRARDERNEQRACTFSILLTFALAFAVSGWLAGGNATDTDGTETAAQP